MQVVYVLIRMLFFHSTFTWKHWVGLIVTSAAYGISYQQLANMAKPAFSEDGELLDGGFDMTTEGICGYAFCLFWLNIVSYKLAVPLINLWELLCASWYVL